ncbi:MAG: hypothetical protein K2X27_04525 [Candidatus Obscuribacterales bacterium]|nr:hypothetical protein [Candidatus Obscuribacterales bacterium]
MNSHSIRASYVAPIQSVAIRQMRRNKVREAIESIRVIQESLGINRDYLSLIRELLLNLASNCELFPESDFAPCQNAEGLFPLYRLSEDADHSLAMYINSSVGNNDVPPHDHTTWAVTVSIKGSEENRFYERVGHETRAFKCGLRQITSATVRPGVGVCMMPDDVHSIHARNSSTALILHMYGRAIDKLAGRSTFDIASNSYRVAAPHLHIIDAR